MKTPVFNPEINWGHLLVALSFIISAIVFSVAQAGDLKAIQVDVARHERMIEQLNTNQTLSIQTLAAVKALLDEHLKHDNIMQRNP